MSDALDHLLSVMDRLRDPEKGCPWDREQDHRTLKAYLVEESHEVLEAIDSGRPELLKEELGDLLIQVIFHSRIAKENGQFTFQDVAAGIAQKLIRRHPHIFAGTEAGTAEDVIHNWEQIKKSEKKKESVLDGVPPTLPSLLKAFRIQEKASIVGFDWKDPREVVKKVEEEVEELGRALDEKEPVERLEEEFGDVLFSLVNLGRFLKLNAEFCLEKATVKFVDRFKRVEKAAKAQGRQLSKMTLEEMDRLWEETKGQGKQPEQ